MLGWDSSPVPLRWSLALLPDTRAGAQYRRVILPTALVVLASVLAVVWVQIRPLAWDEFEFFRATAWVADGRTPYKDFWEHHSPLQWMAHALPLRLWPWPHQVEAVLFLRWLQAGVLAGVLLGWIRIYRNTIGREALLSSSALAILTPAFLLFATEYRVDAFASALFLLGLIMARPGASGRSLALSGALMALVPLANLRLGPQAVVALALLASLDLGQRRWGWGRHTAWIAGGAGAAMTLGALYFIATGSLGAAWQQLIRDNQQVASLSTEANRAFWSLLGITFTEGDILPALLLASGLAGAVWNLSEIRRPGQDQVGALLFVVNLTFVYALNTHYFYHFQTLILLSIPMNARLMEALATRTTWGQQLPWVVAILSFWTVGLHIRGFHRTHSEGRMAYQRELIEATHNLTRPEEKVWDGCGFAMQREPAYRYWFLPVHVRLLTQAGHFEPLTLKGFHDAAPAALILNARTYNWLQEWPELGSFVHTHYLPVRPHLWIPAPSGHFAKAGILRTWTVLRTGAYQVMASRELAAHPYFQAPYLYMMVTQKSQPPGLALGPSNSTAAPGLVTLRVNGVLLPLSTVGEVRLQQGDTLEVRSEASAPIGVFFRPLQVTALFVPSPCKGGPDAPLYSYF